MRGFRSGCLIVLLLGAGVASGQERARVDALGDPLPAGALARLGTTRFRPGGWISHLAFSPDGGRLACWSAAGLSVYDSATGRELRHVALTEPRMVVLAWPKGGRGLAVLELGDQSLYVWDITDPQAEPPHIPRSTSAEIINLRLDGERYGTLAVSADGKYLAAGRRGRFRKDRTVDLFDLAPGKRIHELKVVRTFGPQPGDCVGLAFTHDTLSLLVFSHERGAAVERLIAYDVATGEPRRRLTAPANALRKPDGQGLLSLSEYDRPLALAPDDRTAALAAADGTVRVWDMMAGKEIRSVARHVKQVGDKVAEKGVLCTAFAAGGRTLITSGRDARTCVWDTGTGRKIRDLGPGLGEIHALAVSPDGKRFATCGDKGQVRLWDAETGASASAVADYPDVDWGALAIAPDGRTATSVGTDGGICVWDLADGGERRRIDRPRERAFQVCYTPDGKAVLVGGGEAKMQLFDLVTGKPLPLPGKLGSTGGRPAGLSADRRTLVNAHEGGVTLWDWPAGRPRWTFKPPGKKLFGGRVCLSPDGRRLVTVTGNNGGQSVEVWEVPTGRSLGRQNYVEDYGLRPFFSPDGSDLLLVDSIAYGFPPGESWHIEPVLNLWDSPRLKRRRDFVAPPLADTDSGLQLGPVAFSSDGRTLAVGSGHRPVTLYEVATGQVRRQLVGHRDHVTSLEFTPDGRRLLSTSSDRTGLVWDMRLAAGAKPAAAARDRLWDDLADVKAAPAYRALARLAADPAQAVALVRARLKPARAPDDAELDRIVADLDSARFAVRQKATADLNRLGEAAAPGMAARLPGAKSLELRRRIEQFLAKHDRDVPSPQRLREGRAVELLEQIGTEEARGVLRELAKGSPVVRLTQDAAAALRRLGD